MGNGNDTVDGAGAGSVVYAGQGHDVFHVSNQVELVGVKHTDEVILGTDTLTGGIQYKGSESPWALNVDDGTRYGFDPQGDLVIKDAFGDVMGIANGVSGPGHFGDDSAGLYVAQVSLTFSRIADLKEVSPAWQSNQFAYVNAFAKAYGEHVVYAGVDPIVLDLSGNGLHLTDVSSAAPRFDINGDGFAVKTGWVEPSTGILVLDKNGNGVIDNIGEMFGGPGLDGYAALAAYDTNGDGVIDANDAVFSQLRVWVDGNGNGVTDPGELKSLADLGITSIGLDAQSQTDSFVAGNQVLETGTFTRSDGTTGLAADVALHVDNYDTRFRGDTTVTAAAAGLPEQKGYGTLTDLSVAISHDPTGALAGVIAQTLPTLNAIDLPTLLQRVTPILTAWAAAVQVINPDGTLSSPTPSGHADLPILMSTTAGGTSVADFAYQVSDTDGSYFKLASGTPVLDADGHAIARPTLAQVLAQASPTGQWTTFSGADLDFMERYLGDTLPVGSAPTDPAAALANLGPVITQMVQTLNEIAVSIAMQGPLAAYFAGLAYDVTTNSFHATTTDQLAPMYEAVFRDAPADAAGAAQWLAQWKPILDVVLGDFARDQGLEVTYGYRFVNVVAAYEAVGLPLDIRTAASALGIPSDLIFTGSTTLDGSAINDADLFYLSGGDQTAIGGAGPDNYIIGGTIGHDTIVDHQGAGNDNPNTVRFASVKSTDVTASRVGLDLVLKVKGTDEQITVQNQFTGRSPGLLGGNLNDVWGVAQITFADGVVWEQPDIAFAVAPNTDGVNGTLIGTGAMDVLDGGRGNHFMSGGDGGDVYLYDRGDGADTILDNKSNIFDTAQNYVSFGPGLTQDDVVFSRDGASGDLQIQVKDDPTDTLLVQGQFAATYTGVFGTQYFDQIQNFRFSDGTMLTWQDVQDQIIAQEEATPGAAIYGFASGDTIDPGVGGNHYMSGGNGEHTYVFGMGYGNDTIEVNSSNILAGNADTVLFNPDVDPSDVQVIRNGGSGDFTLALSDGSTLAIVGQFDRVSTFDIWFDRVANFQFQDASNTLWTYQDIEKKVIQYEIANSHQVYGTPDPDVLDPGQGAGGYYLQGGYGGDTYVFGEGYGHDTIFTAHYPLPASDTVLFNADVDPSTVRFSRGADPGTLAIILADGSELDVQSQYSGGLEADFYSIANFQFQDGAHTTLSAVDVAKKVIQDEIANGNHTVLGTQYSDTIDTGPGAGGYFLSGGNGGDTYVFGEGYGHDTIYAGHYPYWSADTLLFNPDVDPSTVHFERGANPDDLAITLADGSEIDVQGQFGSGYLGTINQLANFQFQDANHTLLNLGQIEDIIFATEQATPGAIVYGEHAGQTLDGYGGNNTLVGYGGGNTFDFGLGYGHELVRSSGNGSDVVQLGAGITPDMVDVSRPADPLGNFYSPSRNLVLRISGTDDVLTVHDEFPDAGNPSPVGQVRFADGTVWDAATLAAMASTPQTIVGSDGNDTLIGNASDKILVGQGANTVAYYGVDNAQVVLANHVAYIDGASPYGGDTITGISTAIVAGHNDTLWGTGDGNSTLIATGVDDTLIAGFYGGGDTLIGTDGVGAVADIIWTNSNMTIDLGAGRTYVNGQAHDVLIGIEAASADGSGTTLIGGAGNDTLMSKGTGNTLIGGVGTDTLMSTGAGNTLIAGAGSDFLSSTGHSNTLIGGSGSATLSDGGTGDTLIGEAAGDTLIGTNATDLTVRYSAANLLVDLGAGIARIGGATSADTLVGITSLDVNGSNDTLIGGGDGDLITAFGYGDTVIAGTGSETFAVHGSGNTLIGGNGDDTFLYQSYDGDLDIQVSPQTSWDPHTHTLKFVDFNQSDVSFAQVGNSLVITCLHFGGTITIDNQYLDGQGLQRIEFADGTALDSADIATLVELVGSGQTRSITGDQLSITVQDAAHLTVTGSSNAVTVTGDNSMVLASGDSSVVNLLASGDSATIEGGGATGFVAGPNANIAVTGDSGTLTIRGDGAIAAIHGDSGNITSWGNAVHATVTGSFANLTSFGNGMVATVNGDSGSITSFGNAAHLTVNGSYGTLHSFTDGASLALNGDFGSVSAFGANLTVQLEGNHGSISANGADGQFLLQGGNGYVNVFGLNAHIEVDGNNGQAHAGDDDATVVVRGDNGFIITFGNNDSIALNGNAGTVLSFGDGGTVAVTGNANTVSFGSDQVVAAWGSANTLNFQGSASTARVADQSGDMVVYSASDGNLDVQDIVGGAAGGSPADNVLQLSDLNPSDVVLSRAGSALDISVVSSGAVISVEGEFTAGDNPIQQIQFADGTTLTSDQMLASTPLVVSGDGVAAIIDLAGDVATLAGANDSLTAAGDAESVTVTGTGDSVVLAGAQDTLTVSGDSASVVDDGSGNTVVLNGNNAVGQFFGTDGTITSTGQGNYLILAGTQDVTVTGENTGINNLGVGMAITLTAAGDNMSMNGSDDTTTVTGDHITVGDAGANDVTTLSGNFDNASLQGTNGTIVSTGHDNNITLGGDSQSVTATGENTYVSNGGTGLTVTLSAAGDSIDLTAGASSNTTTLATDGGSVRDFGTGNTTTMSGDNQVGQFYGTNGTIVSTGQGNYLILTGTQTVTVTGENTGINNLGVGMAITLAAAGDNMSMNGSNDTTTVTGDHITVGDAGANDVTTLSGNFDNASLQGTNGTIVSTGHDNNITLSGDSQSVTATGENTYVSNGGTGLTVTLSAAGDSIDLTAGASSNTTTLATDGGSVRDFGTGNTTTMSGDNQVGQFYGTNGTIVSTGQGNYLILTGTQTVTVTGENTGINNLGVGMTITLAAAGDNMSMNGSDDTTMVTGDHVIVGDAGTGDTTVLSGNFDNASLQGTNGTIVSTGHDNNITLSGDSQSVTATGENTYVSNGGTGLTVTLSAAGDSIDLTAGASSNTTTLATDGGSVRDFGTGNTTTMSGDNQVGQFYGTNGTIVSTGQGNYLILTGTQTVTVTGENTGINNLGVGMTITLAAAGDNMSMNGSDDTTTVTGDHITVGDAGANDVTTLSGNFDGANLSGANGTVISTGHDNTITVSGDSQSVTVTGENTQVFNAGSGLDITLSAAGDAIDLTADAVGNTTTLGGDGLTMRDFGTGNTTTLSGDDVVASFYGTDSTVRSTGNHNYLILSGGQTVSVSGADSGINDVGNGSTITLAGTGDYLTLGGSGHSTSITADGVSVQDNAGGNQFAIANGSGADTLHLAAGQSDVANFGSGIAYDQLWFAQSGQDLVVSVIGRDQTLTVAGWYGGAGNHLGELETADGHQVSDTGMEQLVQAMSAYTPPAEGQTILPPDLAQALAPALTANWH